jgi:hypothetical protein
VDGVFGRLWQIVKFFTKIKGKEVAIEAGGVDVRQKFSEVEKILRQNCLKVGRSPHGFGSRNVALR